MLSLLLLLAGSLSASNAALLLTAPRPSELHYSRAHSLGENYLFDAAHGWESVNVTNLQYKYRRSSSAFESEDIAPSSLQTRGTNKSDGKKSPASALTDLANHALNEVWKGLKGTGTMENVKITWYTGQDLQNPSCWSNPAWAPTDTSFACALTLEGWSSKPKCFKFLELCNGPKKCVFVRVVDSCAGCDAGSKHVDLTKAAFGQLADLGDGILTVQMRPATEPSEWFLHLWGPKK